MKKFVVVLAAIVAAGLLNELQAAKQRFPISLSGSIVTTNGTQKVTDQNWVTTPGNRLAIVIDLAAQTVEIEEWSSNLTVRIDRQPPFGIEGTNIVFASFRMAYVLAASGKKATMQTNLEQADFDWDNDDLADSDGDIQLAATLTIVSNSITAVKGKINGLINDSVNGATGTINQLVTKGSIKSTGPAF